MRFRHFLPLAAFAILPACTDDDFPEPLVPLDQVPVFAVRSVSPSFDDTSFAMLDGDGEPIYEAWVTSGVTPVGLSGAIQTDNAMPTVEVGDGTFTIIDRAGGDRITRFQFPEGTVLGQMRTQLDDGSAFNSNPQDVVFLDATRALVSRYKQNLDPEATPLDRGTDLVEFDPSTMTLTSVRVDLSGFNTTVPFEGDDGPVTLDVYARPARMVRTGNGFVLVGLEMFPEDFETTVDGIVAIVDEDTYDVDGFPLEGLQNCGVLLPVPGAPNRVAVRCLGFGEDPDATSGLVVLEVSDEGAVSIVDSYIAAEHEGEPNVTNNILFLTPTQFVGVDQGGWGDPEDVDVVYFVDLETSEATPILTAPQGTDVFGSMAYNPENGRVLVPSRAEGLHRLVFANGTLTYDDTIGIFPTSLAVIDVSRLQ